MQRAPVRPGSRVERLLERWRPYRPRRLTRREIEVELAAAGSFVAVAAALPLVAAPERPLDVPVALALTATLALASRVRLYFGAGYAMPTPLVLVPMLFLLPPASVPAWAGLGIALPAVLDALLGRAHPERILTGVADAWHAVGPSLVFVVAGAPDAELAAWPTLFGALVAQCATDLLSASAREWLGRAIPVAAQLRVIASVYVVDVCLTPIGLLIALAAAPHEGVVLLVLPLIALLAALAHDRRARMEEAVAHVEQLRAEHDRLDRLIHRIGEAFASKLDRRALVDLVLRTAAEALGAEQGRAALASGTVEWAGEATERVGEETLAEAERGARREGGLCAVARGREAALAHPLGGDVLVVARRGASFTTEEQALFVYLAQQTAVAMENVALHDLLRRQATVDDLTGLANHRRFHDALAQEVRRTRRSGRPLALLLIDVDDFKAVNDTHGHRQGDIVLQAVAGVVDRGCRATDLAARYGGEELAVILPETDLDGAHTVAEAIRGAVERLEVPLPAGAPVRVTVSVGISALDAEDADAGALIEAADAALYAAKRAGKNRTRRGERVDRLRR